MASPLLGVAGVNSLLFGSFVVSKRLVSPYPNLTIAQTALAGAMAGAVTSTLAGPVEMFKIKYAPFFLRHLSSLLEGQDARTVWFSR